MWTRDRVVEHYCDRMGFAMTPERWRFSWFAVPLATDESGLFLKPLKIISWKQFLQEIRDLVGDYGNGEGLGERICRCKLGWED